MFHIECLLERNVNDDGHIEFAILENTWKRFVKMMKSQQITFIVNAEFCWLNSFERSLKIRRTLKFMDLLSHKHIIFSGIQFIMLSLLFADLFKIYRSSRANAWNVGLCLLDGTRNARHCAERWKKIFDLFVKHFKRIKFPIRDRI